MIQVKFNLAVNRITEVYKLGNLNRQSRNLSQALLLLDLLELLLMAQVVLLETQLDPIHLNCHCPWGLKSATHFKNRLAYLDDLMTCYPTLHLQINSGFILHFLGCLVWTTSFKPLNQQLSEQVLTSYFR